MTPTLGYLLAVLGIVLVIDFALRALPFAILEPLRESRFVRDMGRWMPAGILFVLAVVTLQGHMVAVPGKWWAAAVATGLTVATHLLGGRRMMLSILVGTASYVALLALST
ncbi:AzlD domain-containing protein [Schaalia sp. 19OD2882]|uniref:branched-chain amino acid transporter permease n=1 Tax=Schaalia sp. 19OD2882 TaxID=2794089 RepID=UPI001C1F09B0|nr:AzlD domain-containing protein [Schaalia sp. 19OD2882]QWW19555.1 AzlD domain-containing protein [Schaalia sp. 19OD2882]